MADEQTRARTEPRRTGESWHALRAEGPGPFATIRTWRSPDGREAAWESRTARRRGAVRVRPAGGAAFIAVPAEPAVARRLRRLNWVAAVAFTLGGLVFALGAAVAQLGSGDATTAASIYFVGGLCFNTGAYASLLGAINAPREIEPGAPLAAPRWRWWSYEPERADWLSTFVLFAGTLAFGVSLLDSFMRGLSVHQVNRLIWAPEIVGCVLFLVSGHLAMAELCHRFRPCLRRRDLAWWIVAINQVGSVLFMIAAVAAFIRPATGSEVNVDVANWGTLAGALCFAVGGVLQAFEQPPAQAA